MNALTLLAFFFFVNMLQNCLKDHMVDMNPTVMVLTASGTRNRFNKLAEMNSREQTSTTATESAAEPVAESSWNQAALVPAVASSAPPLPSIVLPTVVLQSPYSGLPAATNKPHHNPYQNHPPAMIIGPTSGMMIIITGSADLRHRRPIPLVISILIAHTSTTRPGPTLSRSPGPGPITISTTTILTRMRARRTPATATAAVGILGLMAGSVTHPHRGLQLRWALSRA